MTQKGYFLLSWVCPCPKLRCAASSHLNIQSLKNKSSCRNISQELYRPLDQTPVTASRPLACRLFDVLKQFIFVIISKRRRVAIKHARYTLSAEGPSRPAAPPSLFYFISLGFWLMSVTANGNKMLVRVCAVAWEHRLWYIVRPFASVSWLPCHRLHVYWLGVNKARASTYFALPSFGKKVMLPLKWKRYFVRQQKCICCRVSFTPFFFFFALCVRCSVEARCGFHWLLLSLLGIN